MLEESLTETFRDIKELKKKIEVVVEEQESKLFTSRKRLDQLL
jgi:regulator of replication initiation timing